jgi:lipid A 3-O-deacylase
MCYRLLWMAAVCFGPFAAIAQAIDNTVSFRDMNADYSVRLTYENDYFTSTDYYYTQGINVEIIHPRFQQFFLSKVLFAPAAGKRRYGIAIEHNGYTPTSINHPDILYGDRPFAATLLFKTFSTSNVSSRHLRIASSLTLGVLGPAAGGREMQTTIHRWIKDDAPLGWQYQIQNDVVVNYETGFEKALVQAGRHFMMNGLGRVRAGTLSNQLSSGLVILVGKLSSAIVSTFAWTARSPAPRSRPELYFYAQPMLNMVAYDATLQGGLFNRSSPYTLSSREIEHVTVQGNYGLVFQYHGLYLEYFQSILSKEFKTGLIHRWGGIRIGMKW